MTKKKNEWFWLSFCDRRKKEGDQFVGVSIVQGRNFDDALEESFRLGINPGGEVRAEVLDKAPSKRFLNKLLNRKECEEVGEQIV